MPKTLDARDLDHFTGSEEFYTQPLYGRVRYTEGVRHVAEAGEAYWLLDAIIFSARHVRRLQGEAFQVWHLAVLDGRGVLTCTDGDSDDALYTQRIPYTDFPVPEVTLWLVDGVLMLPSEY
jgi:hypothetical protein